MRGRQNRRRGETDARGRVWAPCRRCWESGKDEGRTCSMCMGAGGLWIVPNRTRF